MTRKNKEIMFFPDVQASNSLQWDMQHKLCKASSAYHNINLDY